MATQILLIEDEVQIRENLEELLTLHGFQVETASNGRAGISQAMLHAPDLILCDIMMPEVDGYQVLEAVRTSRLLANVPFIFLTAKTDPADIRLGMNQGADDYLTKPFKLEDMLRTIESRLERESLRKANLKAQVDTFRLNLASVTPHAYDTALSGIIGLSALLIDACQQFTNEEIASMAMMIKTSGQQLKRSLDNIQLMDVLQQVDTSHREYAYFSTGSTPITTKLVDDCIQTVAHRQDRTINYQLDVESAQLRISEVNLETCLGELIDNSFKFSDPKQTVLLTGTFDDEGYRLTFTNKGQPFNAGDFAQIAPYQQFDRNKYEQQGFGLGLSIAKKIIELNKGWLTIESPLVGVTTLAIWIPREVSVYSGHK